MNKLTKRVLSVFLALAMIVTILPPVTAQAATKTEKMTLYKGEIVKNYVYGTLKSVSSSKKAVAIVETQLSLQRNRERQPFPLKQIVVPLNMQLPLKNWT